MSEARLDKLCFQICNAPSINPEDRQAVIIAGVRTPFVKSFGKLMHVNDFFFKKNAKMFVCFLV
jgi:hypothetical protein